MVYDASNENVAVYISYQPGSIIENAIDISSNYYTDSGKLFFKCYVISILYMKEDIVSRSYVVDGATIHKPFS